jgi:L-serine deaminase
MRATPIDVQLRRWAAMSRVPAEVAESSSIVVAFQLIRPPTDTLDQVIKPMRQTGTCMQLKYRENSSRSLPVNVPEC